MIITLTPNPAVDQTAWVDRLRPGSVHRVRETHVDPAGKGVNASRMIHRLGRPTLALGLLAGDTGNIVEKALDAEGVQHHFVRVAGQTRVNVTVVDDEGTSTSFYAPGPVVDARALAALEEIAHVWLEAGRVLVLAGSLPPGMPESAYASYVRAARERGVKVILDADGAALRHGLTAKPDLIKPNLAEAEALVGRPLRSTHAVVDAAREIVRGGVGTVVVSMGADGAICVHGESAWHVRPPLVDRESTVGSGDSMVAGLAIAFARGVELVEGLRLGAAAGAATAQTPGTMLGAASDVLALLSRVRLERVA